MIQFSSFFDILCFHRLVIGFSKPGPIFQAANKVKEGTNYRLPFSLLNEVIKGVQDQNILEN